MYKTQILIVMNIKVVVLSDKMLCTAYRYHFREIQSEPKRSTTFQTFIL